MNLPNKLTMLRIAMIPFFVAAFYWPWKYAYWIAALLFSAAFVTDLIDGHIARKHNLVTNFGKLMDPIADKLLTAAALVMLTSSAGALPVSGSLSPIVAIVIISREFIVSGIRLVAAGKGVVVAANWLGKAKTTAQFVMLLLLLIEPALDWLGWVSGELINLSVWSATILTILSGIVYVKSYWPLIDPKK